LYPSIFAIRKNNKQPLIGTTIELGDRKDNSYKTVALFIFFKEGHKEYCDNDIIQLWTIFLVEYSSLGNSNGGEKV